MPVSKIKILMVLGGTSIGGAESYVMNILRNIDFSRYQVDFAVSNISDSGYTDEIYSFGCRIFVVPYFKIYNYIQYCRAWENLLKKEKFDIVHGHSSNSAAVYLRIARSFGCKTIVHSHSAGYRGGFLARTAKEFFGKRSKKYADLCIGCSDLAAKRIYGNNFKEDSKYRQLPNAINVDQFLFSDVVRERIRRYYFVKDDEILYGHVGSFTSPKNHLFLIDIFNEIHKKNNNARLLLCGSGPLLDKVKQKVQKYNLTKYVIFAGSVKNINEHFMGMDRLLFPSLFEGLPVTVVEAQAAGLPVLMSDVITDEVILSDCVKKMSLTARAEEWAAVGMKIKSDDRIGYNSIVGATQYNMRTSIQQLCELYNQLVMC